MINDLLKKYEGKKVVITKKDKGKVIGIYRIKNDNTITFEKNNIEIFSYKGNPQLIHKCPLTIYVSAVTKIETDEETHILEDE